jgi:ADP-ribose pyrophosphatase YjhB (NUDIX family)
MDQTTQPTRPQPPLPPPVPLRPPRLKARLKPSKFHSKKLHKKPRKIRREVSAGGVAARQENGVWMVALLQTEHKRGLVWVLPKGHIELHAGEKASEAAGREVREEAGLTDLSVKDQLGITRFRFQVEDGMVYKTVHYFLMYTTQKTLTPQKEEGLLDARWFEIDNAIKNLAYDTDQEIVARAREKLTGQKRSRIHT